VKRFVSSIIILAFVVGGLLEAAPAERSKPIADDADRLIINLSDVTLHTVLQYVSLIKGKLVKLPAGFKGDERVNIISPASAGVPRDKAMDIFAMILRGAGYVMEETPDYIRIVPEKEAKAVPIHDGTDGNGDGLAYITRDVMYADAGKLAPTLGKLSSKAGSVEANTDLNKLIIKDYGPNRRAILYLLQILDQKDLDFVTKTWKLENRSVDSLSRLVQKFIENMGKTAGIREKERLKAFEVEAQPVTNSFVLFGSPSDVDRVIAFIKQFDVEPDEKDTGFQTYSVKNRDVTELKAILDDLFTQSASAMDKSLLEQPPKIIVDETNAQLIILASQQKYREIEPWLAALDTEQPQVMLESTYIEIGTEKLADFGVELATLDGPGSNVRGFMATSMGLSTITEDGRLPIEPALGGLTAGVFRDEALNIAVLARLSQKDEDISFVAAPSVMTVDNKEASILLSEEREYETSTFSAEGDTREITSGGFHKADIELVITPHVKEGGVRLNIMTRIEQFLPSSGDLTNIAKRKVTTEVHVPDGSTVVIAGLTRTLQSKEIRKVPILGDIPLLGFFFKRTITTNQKRHLCIFITPRVLKTGDALASETRNRAKALDAQYPEGIPAVRETLENAPASATEGQEVSNQP